ncbi:MAG: hypothetical protein KAT62_10885 [Desulfuromonadales bacterium]|nr:hypothetical protein [Desulfuromonadales bacterium]
MPEEDLVIRDATKIIVTLGNLFKRDDLVPEHEILSEGSCEILLTDYDNWDGGTDIYGIFCKVSIGIYSKYELEIQTLEENIKDKAERIFRTYPGWLGEVVISPELSEIADGKLLQIDNDELVKTLEKTKNIMASVSTGGPKIQTVNNEYKSLYEIVSEGLAERNIKNEIPFADLWEWYGKWSDGSLPQYKNRREFLAKIFSPMLDAVKKSQKKAVNPIFEEPTGWMRVDRGMAETKKRLVQASTEEQFQVVGLLCRETLISLAQTVFVKGEHETTDGVEPSKTDAKRMLEAYLSSKLPGKSNENIRRHAKASLDVANDLTHRRTAEFRLAALCAEATNAVINIVAIVSGRRDPRSPIERQSI